MSGRAFFEQLRRDRWSEVERWLREKEPESLHLDFKQLGDKDKYIGNVAKALSAFANVEGGVLVLGIETTRGGKNEPDRASAVASFADPRKVEKELEGRLASGLTDPTVPGVQIETIVDPARDTHGIIAIFVPPSDGGPHQVSIGDKTGRYYMRTSTISTLAPHSVLAALFGRQPGPRLRLGLCRSAGGNGEFWIENYGRGLAESILLRVHLGRAQLGSFPRSGRDLFEGGTTAPCWGQRPKTGRDAERFRLALELDPHYQLYPQDDIRAYTFGAVEVDERLLVRARIDVRGAAPVQIDETIQLTGVKPVWLPSPETT